MLGNGTESSHQGEDGLVGERKEREALGQRRTLREDKRDSLRRDLDLGLVDCV